MTIEFTIDGKKARGSEGETVLDVAKANDIDIPTLCHHEAVANWGGCRLCIVEIAQPEWNGQTKIVTSCLFKIKSGLTVTTNSARVAKNRETILNLLLAQAPNAKEVKELAKKYGVTPMKLIHNDAKHRCITCGLCTRLCAAQDAYAIATVHRGPEKAIGAFWQKPPESCIGCLICASNCPTQAIGFKEKKGSRHIWKKDFKLAKCSSCDSFLPLTEEQVKHYALRSSLGDKYFTVCEDCRRKETTNKFLDIIHDPAGEIMEKWNAEGLPPLKMPSPTKKWLEEEKRRMATKQSRSPRSPMARSR
ncbi:MAG: hypothetical protein COV46_06015 [Deltaproteobacteria bacterium CG11_big_fil_rev_8_21_14_0_20_49_13]|nr:MAG: hypothetical protein COV46_06015 [Deltaproteobacteria bacterium CG11_big_fil_rev_8_21_14_0_20_49_13]